MKKLVSVILAIVFVLGLTACSSTMREYYEDITITLQDSSEKIIVKEWCYLQGSGAEVYYQKGDAEPILLGKTTGGDDGFCPFQEGLYEITENGRSVTVKWCFNPSDGDKTNWRSESFDLPLVD